MGVFASLDIGSGHVLLFVWTFLGYCLEMVAGKKSGEVLLVYVVKLVMR